MNRSESHAEPVIKIAEFLNGTDISNDIYIGAAGFEDRAPVCLEQLARLSVPPASIVIIRYEEEIAENTKNYEQMHKTAVDLTKSRPLTVTPNELQTDFPALLGQLPRSPCRVLVDISAMRHRLLFTTLTRFQKAGFQVIVFYTEAETYYPLESYSLRLPDGKTPIKQVLEKLSPEDAFLYLSISEYENDPFMTEGGYVTDVVPELRGNFSPHWPTVAAVFPTFKRLRTSRALADLEGVSTAFILGRPERAELQWREKLLRVVNFDLLRASDRVVSCSTLHPNETVNTLIDVFEPDGYPAPANQVVIPHGSKMQTVGIWEYCIEHPWIRVLLTSPRAFYPTRYSEKWRDIFVFRTMKGRTPTQ